MNYLTNGSMPCGVSVRPGFLAGPVEAAPSSIQLLSILPKRDLAYRNVSVQLRDLILHPNA